MKIFKTPTKREKKFGEIENGEVFIMIKKCDCTPFVKVQSDNGTLYVPICPNPMALTEKGFCDKYGFNENSLVMMSDTEAEFRPILEK